MVRPVMSPARGGSVLCPPGCSSRLRGGQGAARRCPLAEVSAAQVQPLCGGIGESDAASDAASDALAGLRSEPSPDTVR